LTLTQTTRPLDRASWSFWRLAAVDEAVIAGADGLEQQVEQGLEFGGDLAVVRDEDLLEQRLIHLATDARVGLLVGLMEVRDESKCAPEVRLNHIEVQLKTCEPLFDMT
jgi:hypothetical protein